MLVNMLSYFSNSKAVLFLFFSILEEEEAEVFDEPRGFETF